MTAMMLTSCGRDASNGASSSNEAFSSNEVTIGKQVWMTENLNVDKFRNGEPIPQAKSNKEWEKAGKSGQPAWCYLYNYDDTSKLYNWYAVNDPRGLAPEGWKIPTEDDWDRLTTSLGGLSVAGKKMKFTDLWVDYEDKSGNGTNESGFATLPWGGIDSSGIIAYFGSACYLWSSTESDAEKAWARNLVSQSDFVFRTDYYKEYGFSVRCLRD